MKEKITFVIGGCKSGKSSFALEQANRSEAEKKYFIATSMPADSEMEQRVQKHQKERGKEWITIEEPVRIHEKINEYSDINCVILVDCLTLWVSNLLFYFQDQAQIEKALADLEKSLERCNCPLFLVSNEVGTGVVPENMLARQFRDCAGLVNQRIAKIAGRVVTTIAGIDVQIKPKPLI